jgi:hypothetical protein
MRTYLKFGLICAAVCGYSSAFAATPTCNSAANENKISWPDAQNPVWEMCWLTPLRSSGPRGSGLELRNIHFRGVLMVKRAHSPNLFAEYLGGAGGDCYRDWKDENSAFAAEAGVRNILGTPTITAKTNCDVSLAPTASYPNCPYTGSGVTVPACATAGTLAIENLPSNGGMRLTTQYTAGWYKYTARYIFTPNGDIDTEFGFGNSNGTYNNVTHWHQNYFRFDFDINGAANDQIRLGTIVQPNEFFAFRSASQQYQVIDADGGYGYQINPGPNDDTYPANESGRNFHSTDIIGTKFVNNEFSDNPTWNLGDCTMRPQNIVSAAESIDRQDVVLYYRASVRDSTANSWPVGCTGAACVPQDSMVCKKVGPKMQLIGNFPVPNGDFQLFRDGME